MAAPRVRVDYEALKQIAQGFSQQADATRQTLQTIQRAKDVLEAGDWIGQGATAFYNEMHGDVLPTITRLVRAFEAGNQAALQINQTMKAAEDDAARVLRGDGARGGGAAAAPGQAGAAGAGGASAGQPGQAGGGAAPGSGGETTGGAGESGGFMHWLGEKAKLEPDGKLFEFDFKKGGEGGSKSPFSPELAVKYGVAGSVWGDDEAKNGWAAVGGGAGVKFGMDKEGPIAALYAEAYGFSAKGETLFAGDKDLGVTGAGQVKVLAGEAVAGFKDGSLGATIGGTLASVKGEVGANVAGYNVGVSGEVGLKAELGFKIGKKTEIKLPFVTLGISFGGAKE